MVTLQRSHTAIFQVVMLLHLHYGLAKCFMLRPVLFLMLLTTVSDHFAVTASLQTDIVAKSFANVTHSRVEERIIFVS